MTEYDLFVECLPMIAEMAVRCRTLDRADYETWKQETMEHAPDMVKSFMGKVLVCIDKVVMGKETVDN